jgi:hypothetical protein
LCSREKRKKTNSDRGNRTPGCRVRDDDVSHYTISDYHGGDFFRFSFIKYGLAPSVAIRTRAWLYIDPCCPPSQQLRISFSPLFCPRLVGEAYLPLNRITERFSSATPYYAYESSHLGDFPSLLYLTSRFPRPYMIIRLKIF